MTNLQAGALVGEGRAEERGHDAHDRLRHVAFQDGVGMLAITGVVADLQKTATYAEGMFQN